MSLLQAESISYFDTEYSADSIEFCPSIPLLFACGTYQVDKQESTGSNDPTVVRKGRCYLFKLDRNGNNLKELQRFESPAILDMKWSPRPWNGYENVLAIADAKGQIQLHSLDQKTMQLSLIEIIKVADEKTLCLSLDWSTRLKTAPDPATIIVSLSNGSLAHLTPPPTTNSTSSPPGPSFIVSLKFHAHDFEPWICSFDCWDSNSKTVWSGGDDLKLKGWNLSSSSTQTSNTTPTDSEEEEEEREMEPFFINKRFEGGVTTITSHPLIENLIAVGSYDSIVRLIDKRTPLKQPVLSSFNCGGGIWRLKWHPTNPKRLLVAAMHNGFSVIDFPGLETTTTTNGESSSERIIVPGEGILVKRFEKHQSLAYGVDWNQGAGEEQTLDGKDLIASCSFYDHALHIWSV